MSMITSPPSNSSNPRRRKRKDQACEPCRKAKTRCDHTTPICLRCQRKGAAANCIYVPSHPPSHGPSSEHSISNPSHPVRDITNDSLVSPQTSGSIDSRIDHAASSRKVFGFYGPTSFSAPFLDNENGLVSDVDDEGECTLSPGSITTPPTLSIVTNGQQTAEISLGMRILSQLPDQVTCESLMENYTLKSIEYAFHKPTILHCMKSSWFTFGQSLRHPRRPERLKEVVYLLSKNTSTEFPEADDGDAWLSSISGMNFRWEILGILFCVLGHQAAGMRDKEQDFFLKHSQVEERRDLFLLKKCMSVLRAAYKYVSEIIGDMCKTYSFLVNDDECVADYDATAFKLWRRQGDKVHLATALGLHHCAIRPDSGVTTSLEIKRRIFSAVFVNDKTLSIFTGRPPGLSRRYNSCPLPLDLEDEILLAGKETLQKAASKLDENGWNKEGNIYSSSRIRASMMYGEIIDEILEISLGTVNQFSEARIMDLRKRNENIQERLPPWLRLSSSTPTNSSTTTHWIQTALKFNCLQCSFILEQVFVRKVKGDKQPLLDISRQLLALTVSMWTSKDRFLTYYSDYDWIIMCYGIPSAGVICVELIKEMENPAAQPAYYLSRSEVIQNLSLLVGFLDWVRPTAANHELCGRMRQIVKRTLDKILDPPKITNTPKASTSTTVPISNLNFEPMVMDDLDWLDTIDWAKGPFMDLRMEGYNEFS
ncbi:hypothetical protein BCON_0093g00330 [Botryotinia convoluta]|uniref:Zn(2)-C6 fungal-type domain-containing protein n=1 Tax=Botryotinia convoluta TaxID=54673 RepID=A0A4Z1I916_9HELO|nr:hypothetical protein BCON_0093g00330 [Botryotinia convoluta]